MWVEGTVGGQYIRRSLKTYSWEKAQADCRRMEDADNPAPKKTTPVVTIAEAVDAYLSDAKTRGLSEGTLHKLTGIFKNKRQFADNAPSFLTWATERKYTTLDQLDLVNLREFRSTWKDAPLAMSKKQERVLGFLYFCVRNGWLTRNPMVGIGKIKVEESPTDYFPSDEFSKIVDATYLYRENRWEQGEANGTRIRTLTLLMRWSGLRIRDAVTLDRSRLSADDKLVLYQAKTGHPVYVPLPPTVAEALRTVPPGQKPNLRYFFWSGNGEPKSAVADWQRSYRRLFKLADIKTSDGQPKRCHPHMFRDTFAVEMLLGGVPLEQVSMLLGHKSIKITEKHYSPWVKARQDQLEMSVRKAWESGNVVSIEKRPKKKAS